MLLHDIGKSPDATFKRVNQHLENNYGFKITESISDNDLCLIQEQIQNEIINLKIKGDNSKASPEIAKRLLILEGLQALREFALPSGMPNMQSSKLQHVVDSLKDYVVDTFELTGMSHEDFEKAMERAMDEYRSSRYRFPDDIIEQKVRDDAISQINSMNFMESADVDDDAITGDADMDSEMQDVDEDFGDMGRRSSAFGGHPASIPDTDKARKALASIDTSGLALQPISGDKQVPMVRDKQGRMVPDPFAAHAAARKQGVVNEISDETIGNYKDSASDDLKKRYPAYDAAVKNKVIMKPKYQSSSPDTYDSEIDNARRVSSRIQGLTRADKRGQK